MVICGCSSRVWSCEAVIDEPTACANEKPKEEVLCMHVPSFKLSAEGTVKIAKANWGIGINELKLPKLDGTLEVIKSKLGLLGSILNRSCCQW